MGDAVTAARGRRCGGGGSGACKYSELEGICANAVQYLVNLTAQSATATKVQFLAFCGKC
jgi:hypothetical protein